MTTSRAYRFALNGSAVPAGRPILTVDGVGLRWGGVRALDGISLTVLQGEIHAIVGPNGAGKSSLLNCIGGLYRPQRGTITLHRAGGPVSLVSQRPSRIARLGVARSFQNIELFRHLTVLENLMLGRHLRMSRAVLPALVWFGPARRQEIAHRELVEEVIDRLGLRSVRHTPVAALSYGSAKRVELGRALCLQPAVMLLDEPTAGMNAEEKASMARHILDVNELDGVSVVLVEHDMDLVMDISHTVTVLNVGRLVTTGPPARVRQDPAVIDAYLGTAA